MTAEAPQRKPVGRLSGRVAIVTGAARGIGAAFADALAAAGAQVVVCDLAVPEVTARRLAAEHGDGVLGLAADVTSATDVRRLAAAAVERFGRIDVLVNNAALFGGLRPQPFDAISSEEWDRVMAVNTRGPFECAKAVVPVMRRQGSGKIVNVASGTFFKGSPELLHYVSSKGAVIGFTRALARELGPDGINVNAIAPGLTQSETVRETALGAHNASTVASRCFKRDQHPHDLVGALLFLASSDSDFMTGQTIVVDGGSVMH